MAKDIALATAKLPAHLQNAAVVTDEFTGGVQSGFPIVSYRGRVWRVKISGEEQINVDDNGDAVASIEVVLLRSNPKPSKIHYDKQYEDGDEGKPRCWSADGEKPSPEVEDPIHPNCQSCPKNIWGSRISESGKKSRACSDTRRMAIAFLSDIEQNIEDPSHEVTPMLLRVPPASLNPLKDYVAGQLAPKGIQPYMLATRIGFDNDAQYPKLTFKPARFLDEDEFNLSSALRDSEESRRILQQVEEEYSSGGTTDVSEESKGAATPKAEAKAAPPESPKPKKKTKPKKRDVTPAEAEAAATQVEVVEEDDDAPAPPTEAVEVEEVEEVAEVATDDFDSMLASILD